jgi:hypothetical protein
VVWRIGRVGIEVFFVAVVVAAVVAVVAFEYVRVIY